MDRHTRKELKTDRFAQEVEHTVEYIGGHRRQAVLYTGIALAVIIVAAGAYFWNKQQQGKRQEALREAVSIQQASIGPAPSPLMRSFATKADKDKAAEKAFTDVSVRFAGSNEGSYAAYMVGNIAMDQGRTADAEKRYKEVIASGASDYAALGKLSLAELYSAQGKQAEAEKLLREVVAKPTTMVSKEQATIALARVLAAGKSEEARKLLEPLRTSDRNTVSRAAITALSQMPRK